MAPQRAESRGGLDQWGQVLYLFSTEGVEIDVGYRIDMVVEDAVLVELKAASKTLEIHEVQALSNLKLSVYRVGLLINFHVVHLKDGIKRFVNGL